MIKQEKKYSLWLRPSQSQIDELTKIISKLSHQYRSTPFPAHITLLHSISTNTDTITKVCEKIIERYSPISISLGEIAYSEAYYRNLYILTNSESLLTPIYEETKNLLKHETNEVFIPHVSLYYGKLDEKKQQALKEKLANSYPKVLSCQRIDLYKTNGKECEWHLINTFNLKK